MSPQKANKPAPTKTAGEHPGAAVKEGWEMKTLGEIADVKGGKRVPKGSELQSEPTGHPYITVSNFTDDGTIDIVKLRYVSDEVFSRIAHYTISSEDLYVSIAGTIGKTGYVPPELDGACLTENACKLVIHPGTDKRFLLYFTKSADFAEQAGANTRTTAQPKLALERLKTIRLCIPPLHEQKRIVALLDEAFAGIATAKANAEKNLQNARALFESHLQAVFSECGEGWVNTTIGTVIRFIDYRGKTPVKTSDGIRLITAKNVKMGYLQEAPAEFIAAASYNEWMTRGIPQKGDVLFTTEAPLANVAQLDTDEKVAFAQRIIIMQPNAAKLDSTFLKYVLLSQPVQQRIRAQGTGATVQGIKASLLKTIEISFPKSLTEQAQIVALLDSLRAETQRLASIYEKKIAALDELKKALLRQAFSGEL